MESKLDLSDGFGNLVMHLALSLFVSWLCVYVSIIKGIKTSGKLSYVFATLPYLILIVILSYACTLPGAFDGLTYLFNPDYEKLLDVKVW